MIEKSLNMQPAMQILHDAQAQDVELPEDAPPEGLVELESGESDEMEQDVSQVPHAVNLATVLTDKQLRKLAQLVRDRVEDDELARQDSLKTVKEGYKLLGLNIEHQTEPWDGACGAHSTLLLETLTRFVAEVSSETWPISGPAYYDSLAAEDDNVAQAGMRVQAGMNYFFTKQAKEALAEHERTLFHTGLAGSGFKKWFLDPVKKRPVCEFVPMEDLILPAGSSDLRGAPYYTHRIRLFDEDFQKWVYAGMYVPVSVEPAAASNENPVREIKDKIAGEEPGFTDSRRILYECHIDLTDEYFNDGQQGSSPYIVTLEDTSDSVVAVYRDWNDDDQNRQRITHTVQYMYMPGIGPYGLGMVHLLGNPTKAATSILRELVDAGTLANLPGGFKARGMKVKNSDRPISPGEWRDVDVTGSKISDNLMPLPYKEPSQTLFQLYGAIGEEARKFVATADLSIKDIPSNAGSMGILSVLERSYKFQSAVMKRVYNAMSDELLRVKELLAISAPEVAPPYMATRKDYANTLICPVADPQASTQAHKMAQLQAAQAMAQAAPNEFNTQALAAEGLRALGFQNPEKFLRQSQEPQPQDPVSENMAILNTQPVKAFEQQDHMAHIKVHMAAMQDPKILQLLANSPAAQAVQAAMDAHLREHAAFAYKREIEKTAGAPVPQGPQAEQMAPQLAQAADQLLGKNMQEAAAQEAMQKMQDPVVQQQQMDLQIRAEKNDNDYTLGLLKLALESETEGKKFDLEAMKALLDAAKVAHGADMAEKTHMAGRQDAAHERVQNVLLLLQKNKEAANPPKKE